MRHSQLRQPHVADLVADTLRRRILSGEVANGSHLPKQDDLLEEFNVSKPSLRESLRILETEGLITIRRGNRGGAVVHVPRHEDAAYTLGLILASKQARIDDVGIGLRELEPRCAALYALRPDRGDFLPELYAAHESAVSSGAQQTGGTGVVGESRHFHELIVARCGNETLALIVGALESLWSAHWRAWVASASPDDPILSEAVRSIGLDEHRQIISHIENGDPVSAAQATAQHLTRSQLYAPLSREPAPRLEASVLKQLRLN